MYLPNLLHDLKFRAHLELVRFLAPSAGFKDAEASAIMALKGALVSRRTLNDEDAHRTELLSYLGLWHSCAERY